MAVVYIYMHQHCVFMAYDTNILYFDNHVKACLYVF